MVSNAVQKPALKYPGGKWRDGKWVIEHLPAHVGYVEICGGGGNVLLRKARAQFETFNEIDEEVTTFFEVLRCPSARAELLEALHWTPWSEVEYGRSFEQAAVDDRIERARRCFVRSWMGIAGYSRYPSGFRYVKSERGRANPAVSDLISAEHLNRVGERFRGVQIMSRDVIELIDKFWESGYLFYFDPPYVPETRHNPKRYKYEFTIEQHVDAAARLREYQGPVVVSGYACELYCELYEAFGWRRVDKLSRTNGGASRVESLWINDFAQQKRLF